MGMKIVLFTEDSYMANAVLRLFGESANIRLETRKVLLHARYFLVNYDAIVIGFCQSDESNWMLCHHLIAMGHTPIFIMLQHIPSNEDRNRAEQIGIKDILLDPLTLLDVLVDTKKDLFSTLNAASVRDTYLVYLGNGIYFHTKQFWVGQNKTESHQLSDLEKELLELLIAYEGNVLYKEIILDEIWNGQIEISSVRKLVQRLKRKLGPAGKLVVGRKQGGYIYQKE